MATDKVYRCDRCGQDTPDGDGKHYKGDRFCPDCAEVVAFWETIEHDESVECVACEWHYPPELGVAVLWDVMGDPRPSIEVCPRLGQSIGKA